MGRFRARTYGIKYQGGAVDLGAWKPPTVTRMTDDGETVLEKKPSMPSVMAVNPAGSVVAFPVATGMGQQAENATERLEAEEKMGRKGFIPMGKCPKSIGLSPAQLEKILAPKMLSTPACRSTPEAPIDDEHPCSCVKWIIEARNKKQAKDMAKVEERYRSKEEREKGLLADVALKLADRLGEAEKAKQ